MIRVTCDGCDKPIDRDNDRWYGLDRSVPPEPLDLDAEGVLLSEIRIGGDHAHHFCSAVCLSAWAFREELS